MSSHLATALLCPASPHIKQRLPGKLTSTLSPEGRLSQLQSTSALLFLPQFPSNPAPSLISHRLTVKTWGAMTPVVPPRGGELLIPIFIPECLDVWLKATVELMMCWQGSWPRRYGWITVERCVYVWVLTTSQTSDLCLTHERRNTFYRAALRAAQVLQCYKEMIRHI